MGLFKPQRDHPYFADAACFPFTAGAGERVHAWWLAEASLLAYVPEPAFVRDAWERTGATVEIVERNETVCHIARTDAGRLVVFRGTAIGSYENYKTDLRVLLVAEGGGKVHRGFRDALDLVWDDVRARLDGPCWFAGHSLGAALATLAAGRHDGDVRAVYAYGAPRPANGAYRDAYPHALYRYVNRDDVVTQLPPPIGYRHVGALRYFDDDGILHVDPDVQVRAADVARRWRRGELRELPREAVLDHAPIRYAALCRKNVLPPR